MVAPFDFGNLESIVEEGRHVAMSAIHAETQRTLRLYLEANPEETLRLQALREQLASGRDIFVRSNMTGHVTTSAAVLNPEGTKVLLIDHRVLKKWLPPGGHYEGPGGLWESAMREVAEETGIVDAVPHPWMLEHGIPLDIDTHGIPANSMKNEGAHFHHDFGFLAVAAEDSTLHAQLAEVHAVKWAPVRALRVSPDARVRLLFTKLERAGVLAPDAHR